MLLHRIRTIIQSKAHAAVAAAENRREIHRCSDERRVGMLRDVKLGVVEAPTAPPVFCLDCGHRSSDGARYCQDCGSQLPRVGQGTRCLRCGADVPRIARFCGACGFKVDPPAA